MKLYNLEIDRFHRLELAKLAAESTLETLARYEASQKQNGATSGVSPQVTTQSAPVTKPVADNIERPDVFARGKRVVQRLGTRAAGGLSKLVDSPKLYGKVNEASGTLEPVAPGVRTKLVKGLRNLAINHPGKVGAGIIGAGTLATGGILHALTSSKEKNQ